MKLDETMFATGLDSHSRSTNSSSASSAVGSGNTTGSPTGGSGVSSAGSRSASIPASAANSATWAPRVLTVICPESRSLVAAVSWSRVKGVSALAQ